MASLMEIMQLCRLCLVKDQVNIPIFEEQGDIRQIFLKISACLPVKVSREDNLPKKICDGCSYKLEILYQFWNTSANSEKQLLKWLSEVGAKKAPASDKVAVAPVQPHSMPSDGVILKQEVVDLADSHSADEIAPDDLNVSSDAQDYIMQQQQLPYQPISFQFQQDGFAEGEAATNASGPSATVTSEATEAAPKRKRRAAAMKALPAHIDSEEEDEDDVDMVETKIAKTEEQTDDSGGEDPEPTAFVGVPSTSTDNEQPGPSGVGKGSAEAPSSKMCLIPSYTHHDGAAPNNNFALIPKLYQNGQIVAGSNENAVSTKISNPNATTISKTIAIPTGNLNLVMTSEGKFVAIPELKIITIPSLDIKSSTTPTLNNLKSNVSPTSQSSQTSNLLAQQNVSPKLRQDSVALQKPIQCKYCERSFSVEHEYRSHFMLCGKKFNEQKKVVPTQRQKFHCSVCNTTLSSRHNYRRHVNSIHGIDEPYKCEICFKPFKLPEQATRHADVHHSVIQPRFECEVCKKQFSSKFYLKKHRVMHYTPPSLFCEHCEKGFHCKTLLRLHVETHRKLFICELCGEKCFSKYSYMKHLRAHKGTDKVIKNYVCSICKKKFPTHGQFKTHMLVHEGIKKQYVCHICGKSITSKAGIYHHMVTHDEVRRFQCNICGKLFKSKKTLTLHSYVHTGERRHKCETCQKRFTQRTTLVIHMRSHTGERPYKCNLCEKAFVSRCLLNAHKKSKHQITK